MKQNIYTAIACFSLALAVILGAWNAHGMEKFVEAGKIDAHYLQTFHTGVQYQFFNSLGILILGFFSLGEHSRIRNWYWCIFVGMCLFSFSLYILSFHQILGSGWKMLGAVTPFGGLLMAIGWVLCGIGFLRKKHA